MSVSSLVPCKKIIHYYKKMETRQTFGRHDHKTTTKCSGKLLAKNSRHLDPIMVSTISSCWLNLTHPILTLSFCTLLEHIEQHKLYDGTKAMIECMPKFRKTSACYCFYFFVPISYYYAHIIHPRFFKHPSHHFY